MSEEEPNENECTCGSQEELHVEFEDLKRKALDALTEIFVGTRWAPPNASILTDAVICMVWLDDEEHTGATRFMATHNWWTTLGILQDNLDEHRDS